MYAFVSLFIQRVWNKEVSVWLQYVLSLQSVGLQELMKGGEMGYFSVHSQNAKMCEPWNQRRRSAFG